MKFILQILLRWLSRLILWKYKPLIIAITGSVGKTSTKEAVFAVVSAKFKARRSKQNYNNEIGLPLTVIGSQSGGGNPLAWLAVLARGLAVFLLPLPYPKILILEFGADRRGDIDYLLGIARPNISIVTSVGPSHAEFFRGIAAIAREKSKIVSALPAGGVAVLNRDDEQVRAMARLAKARVIFYGEGEADVSAQDVAYKPDGMAFKIRHAGNVVPAYLPGACGKPHLQAALAAAGAGIALGMNLVEIVRGLASFKNQPGRLALLPGIKQTLIIDDTYNAAPASTLAALEVLTRLSGKRKIAVLADMTELGQFTEEGHRQVGESLVDYGVNMLVAVGARAKFIADQARHMGYPESQILFYDNAEEAKRPVQDLLRPQDVVLVKGSRAMRMEKIVKEIMAEPQRAEELLVH